MDDTRLIVHNSKVWRVSAIGKMEAVTPEFSAGNDIDLQGTASAVLSPNQEMIAFTQNNDLWVENLKDKTMTRLTRHGREKSINMAGVYVLITCWSFDSRQILYYVTHSETADVDNSAVSLETPSAAYGYRIYDLGAKNSKPIQLPGEFEAWLPNGEFLLTSAETEMFDKTLLLFKQGDELPQVLSPTKGWWGQSRVSSDGRNVLIAFSAALPSARLKSIDEHTLNDDPRFSSRIVKLNLRTKKLFDVSPSGFWSEYQMPSTSPSGKHIAYIQQEEIDNSGYIHGKLVVDDKAIANFPGLPFEYHWINEDTIALADDQTIVLVNANTGKEIWHGSFAPSSQPKLSSTLQ